jgi:hypothetical protein
VPRALEKLCPGNNRPQLPGEKPVFRRNSAEQILRLLRDFPESRRTRTNIGN